MKVIRLELVVARSCATAFQLPTVRLQHLARSDLRLELPDLASVLPAHVLRAFF